MRTIDVNLAAGPVRGHSYAITIEHGSLSRLGEMVQSLGAKGRVMLAMDAALTETHGLIAAQSLRANGLHVSCHSLIADEQHKSLTAARTMYDAMLTAHLDRNSFVIALGGGIVGDVAGFAAATFMRGVPIVHVPTTLLAMVDASIGGKTGVNALLPDGSLGKNLIGAFWQPRAVFVDPATLTTLSDRHFRCGLAECVKHGMIEGESVQQGELAFLRKNIAGIAAKDFAVLEELIARSAAIKSNIVAADEREDQHHGGRALLNLGHTFAHAFESITDLELLHGEAVAIGLIAAMRCSIKTGRMTTDEADAIRSLLASFGLPVRLPAPASISRVRAAMNYDKKISQGKMRLVLPIGLGRAMIVDDVPDVVVDGALIEVGALQ